MHLSAVILPDRTVLATGGSAMEEMAHGAPDHAQIYRPATGTWTHTAQSRVARLYHSVALLTADGKVITAGSNPARQTEELRIEMYWPPYLFQPHGPRSHCRARAPPSEARSARPPEGACRRSA